MANIENVKLGVCSVKFKGVDLGHTQGGETLTYAPEYHEIMVDKYGKTPVGSRLLGERVTVKVALAEFTVANLKVAIPTGEDDADKITFGSVVGKDLLDEAGLLVLHPVANDVSDLSEDVVLYNAVVTSQIALAHQNDAEKLVEVEFTAFVDETKTDGNYLGLIGDSTP